MSVHHYLDTVTVTFKPHHSCVPRKLVGDHRRDYGALFNFICEEIPMTKTVTVGVEDGDWIVRAVVLLSDIWGTEKLQQAEKRIRERLEMPAEAIDPINAQVLASYYDGDFTVIDDKGRTTRFTRSPAGDFSSHTRSGNHVDA